jgi:hypothetical protein
MKKIVAIAIHTIDGYVVHIFKRTTGHDNKYVKIAKNVIRGKYVLVGDKKGWENKCSLDKATKHKITEWIVSNTDFILQKIQELENV